MNQPYEYNALAALPVKIITLWAIAHCLLFQSLLRFQLATGDWQWAIATAT
jgi:hypothetical protein